MFEDRETGPAFSGHALKVEKDGLLFRLEHDAMFHICSTQELKAGSIICYRAAIPVECILL
jgi:hypothetical protein